MIELLIHLTQGMKKKQRYPRFVLSLHHENSILGSSLAREIELLQADP
jgi:hypothetical protein